MRASHLAWLIALLIARPALAQTPTPTVPVRWLIFQQGQSNAIGRAPLPTPPDATSNRLYLFGNDYFWHQSPIEPIDCDAGGKGSCTGPQLDNVSDDDVHFGSGTSLFGWSQRMGVALTGLLPASQQIALVPCAYGGSAISAWLPTGGALNRASLYGSCNYRRTQALLQPGTRVGCMVLDQGETDAQLQSDANQWLTRALSWAASIREDFGPTTPIILRYLSCSTQTSFSTACATVRAAQQNFVGIVTNAAAFDAEGLATSDGAHFTQGSYRAIGDGLASACAHFLTIATPTITPTAAATPTPTACSTCTPPKDSPFGAMGSCPGGTACCGS